MDNLPADVIQITTVPEHNPVSLAPENVVVLTSVTATSFESLQRSSRAPIDLVAVIDRSSSMKERLPLVEETLRFMIQQLKAADKLGLIFYDENVEILLQITSMDQEGKDRALFALKKLKLGGQTNTSGGLLQALDMIRTRKDGNSVCSVLLLTDGLANRGLTKTPQIKKAVSGVLSQIDSIVSIFTFGYGDEPDPEYLCEIADEGNGMFYQIDSPDAIPLAFTDCLGGLLSVVAQHIVVTIEASKGVNLIDVKTHHKKTVLIPGKSIQVTIEDIYSEEQKDMLLMMDIPTAAEATNNYELFDLDISYMNVLTKSNKFIKTTCSIQRESGQSQPRPVNMLIDKQKNRLICAEAMQEALVAGEKSDFAKAASVLEKARVQIMISPSVQDNYCQGLVSQLSEGHDKVSSSSRYKKEGKATLHSYGQAHKNQRCTTKTPSSYQTRAKSNMTNEWNKK